MVEEGGSIRKVQYAYDPDLPKLVSAIQLTFDSGDWLLTIRGDDDTVEISEVEDHSLLNLSVQDVSGSVPWTLTIGKNLRWVWILENQLGYPDGLQFEFTDHSGNDVDIQLIAASSQWWIYSVVRVASTGPRISPRHHGWWWPAAWRGLLGAD